MAFPFLGAALGVGGLLGGRSSARKTQRMQDQAIADWIAYQENAKATAEAAVDANREANYDTLGGLMAGATLPARQNLIDNETDRLFGLMQAPDNTGAGATSFEARKLAEATQQAREMVRANARTRAYGNSYGGMGTVRDRAMREGASGIGFNNEMSLGDLSVLQKRQSVQPIMYQHQSTGLGELMTSFGANMVGQAFAGPISGGSSGPISQSAWTPGGTVSPAPSLGFGSMPPMGYLFPPSGTNLTFGR